MSGILALEVETFSKPGTADVTAGDRKKLAPLIKHYASMAHPFTACKRDQLKHGLSEDHANRRCSVLKKLSGREAEANARALIDEAEERIRAIEEIVGEEAVTLVVENGVPSAAGTLREVAEEIADCSAVLEHLPPLLNEAYSPPSWAVPGKSKGVRAGGTRIGGKDDPEFEKKHPRGKEGSKVGGRFVRKGASGDVVEGAQKKLGISTTGTFNEQTRRAVMRFQRKHGLEVDGVIGRQTATALLGGGKVEVGALTGGLRKRLKRVGGDAKESAPAILAEREEDRLEERTIKVSGYTTKSGKHVDAYSQVRDVIGKIAKGDADAAELPEGIKVKKSKTRDGFEISQPGQPGSKTTTVNQRVVDPLASTTRDVLDASARLDHPKSIGGKTRHRDFEEAKKGDPRGSGTASSLQQGMKLRRESKERVERLKKRQAPGGDLHKEVKEPPTDAAKKPARGEGSRNVEGMGDAALERAAGSRNRTLASRASAELRRRKVGGKKTGVDADTKDRSNVRNSAPYRKANQDYRDAEEELNTATKEWQEDKLPLATFQKKRDAAQDKMGKALDRMFDMQRKAQESAAPAPGLLSVQEEIVDVERRTRDDGIITVSYEKIRSALWDLDRERTKTTEVRTPHGVRITSRKIAPPPDRPYSLKQTEFKVRAPDGRVHTCTDTSEAAEYAKDWDVEARPQPTSSAV